MKHYHIVMVTILLQIYHGKSSNHIKKSSSVLNMRLEGECGSAEMYICQPSAPSWRPEMWKTLSFTTFDTEILCIFDVGLK